MIFSSRACLNIIHLFYIKKINKDNVILKNLLMVLKYLITFFSYYILKILNNFLSNIISMHFYIIKYILCFNFIKNFDGD